jgi:C-terminal peptidase prc
VDGLVLDLRDNRGGLVSEGLEVARLFLGGGAPIVLTQSRAMSADVPRAAGPPLSSAPLAVLVDDHTASASEILAGALKDNCRAVLVGKQTYGKGLIQSVYELSNGSGLVVTVGRYLTPARVDIAREGIKPNFKSMPSAEQAERELEACRISGGVGR